VYDRLRKACPRFLKGCVDKGLSYPASHHVGEDSSRFFGNGLYKKSAYGPADGSDITSLSGEEKQRIVEGRILDLARLGGWSENTSGDSNLPVWQQRGFTWKWRDDGVDIFQRVPGIRMHPTQNRKTLFTALGSRYINAKHHRTFKPPHQYININGETETYLPPMHAGTEVDEPIPEEDLDILHNLQNELAVNIKWEVGDVLVLDNLAIQHSRLPWTGNRKILASFWDEPGMVTRPVSSADLRKDLE